MKKDKVIISITIFFMCIVLTSIIFMQFKTAKQTSLTDIENMNEEELKNEIVIWQKKYNEISEKTNSINEKIVEYEEMINNNSKTTNLLDEELNDLETLVGKTNVQGEGVIITLKDNEEQQVTASILLNLVNESRYAGAEAISINGLRIINMTDIVDVNYVVQIEGHKISSPYTVKCIGDQNYLSSTLNSKDGYIETYTNSGITVEMEPHKDIKIDKYSGELEIKYSKE